VVLVLIVLLVLSAGQSPIPHQAKADEVAAPVQVGVSFSERRAAALGLDYRAAYREILQMHFRVVRLSVYWDEVDAGGYGATDWLMQQSAAAGQPVVLTVGMKALGWPEFYIPQRYQPHIQEGSDVSQDPALSAAVLNFVAATVQRYRVYSNIVRWQVENEPFNRAGVNRWWIGKGLLAQEVDAVRSLDPRPVILNVFGHFDLSVDQLSSHNGTALGGLTSFGADVVKRGSLSELKPGDRIGFDPGGVERDSLSDLKPGDSMDTIASDADVAERDSLALVQPGDTIGFDVYTRIGYKIFGHEAVAQASPDWDGYVARWRSTTTAQGKSTWITEMQAEPWEADSADLANPKSFVAGDMQRMFGDLKDTGNHTVLLWGAEYWLWRLQNGDPSWIENARQILRDEAKAAPLLADPRIGPGG
jgi:hypothetical protein